ncbi:hypothetical protein Hamer_G028249, partial [Homarus americanus]
DECDLIRVNDIKTAVEVKPIPALCTTQEEAGCSYTVFMLPILVDTVINSPDTDVLVVAVAFCMDIDAELYFHTGKGDNMRTIALCQIFGHFGGEVCEAFFHCVTGCDSVSME